MCTGLGWREQAQPRKSASGQAMDGHRPTGKLMLPVSTRHADDLALPRAHAGRSWTFDASNW
jgi:hypothetical protein